ncbi:hypothetical protein DPMN_087325 [Dreissena polymorpha]|uniref:Uncharacterized protein n=1 Tax=Dreissena polymorpha TaxID=45954 RepID=A0A9D4QVE0_DREPO|nr:hypothetical protein DPMN_087325 [Dreissena polymorpha]
MYGTPQSLDRVRRFIAKMVENASRKEEVDLNALANQDLQARIVDQMSVILHRVKMEGHVVILSAPTFVNVSLDIPVQTVA